MSMAMDMEPVTRMTRDIRSASATLSDAEARYLVDSYYQMQEDRIRAAHRVSVMTAPRTETEVQEPNLVIQWLQGQSETLEGQIKGALDKYSRAHRVGKWAREVKGIGPVIASGFIANIREIERFTTVGKLWRYCGVDPTADKRVRGEKLKFNPALKRLTFLTGESFKRCSPNDEDSFYRHWYDKRKAYETAKNEAGDYAPLAEAALAAKNYGKETEAYKAYITGKLPLARIDRRAARWAAKLFISHLHEVWWSIDCADKPYPMLYAHAHLNHGDKIHPPGIII